VDLVERAPDAFQNAGQVLFDSRDASPGCGGGSSDAAERIEMWTVTRELLLSRASSTFSHPE
jgi:hypothetical protein